MVDINGRAYEKMTRRGQSLTEGSGKVTGLVEPQRRSKGKGSHDVTGPRAAGLPRDPSTLIQEMFELRSMSS